ncbi:NHL repeat-containing protein [Microbacterium sp. HD4P20]|uniref:NHL repeat-containing protein n=1 Tax=Microbacterium sp. HD4P20 TaxID=2864874 RepID=UPI001C63E08B|nr:NHL repeat-containing protein [Microbacterium sp. HD4P20]MCP2634998.1 NHL repeat-containing protein [Microbacterium sp. HD4P20]
MHDRKMLASASALMAVAAALVLGGCAPAAESEPTLTGSIDPVAGGVDAAGWTVTAWTLGADAAEPGATATTDDAGAFELDAGDAGIVYVDARPADSDRALLAAVAAADASEVTLNERTTVAAGYGLAQFYDDSAPSGEAKWLANATSMAANLADPVSGDYGEVLTTSPNGSETSTLATFTSLTDILGACLTDDDACDVLFDAGADDAVPATAPAAFAAIARDPSASVAALFDVATRANGENPGLSDPPAAWTLALRFDGDGESLAGPGNFAIDPDGNIWINNNYQYNADPSVAVCGSDQAFGFAPNGELITTLEGGGLSGSGFGIEFDRTGRLWFSNYGFAAPAPGCPEEDQPLHNSMSLFEGDSPLSPDTGFTQGDLSWPQGIEFDANGDLWIANCGNDSVAVYPGGDPAQARNLGSFGLDAPFAIVDNGQNVFITGTVNSAVAVLDRDGTAAPFSPLTQGFDRPMGIAADAAGNVWVANSGGITLPCPDRTAEGRGTPSVTMIAPDGTVSTPYTGGGVTLPWGIATDGDGNLWVADFSEQRVAAFCGADATTCPRGLVTGEAISPDDTGYAFDGLTRSTGIAVDPSGNVWVTNNWITVAEQTNPGGHQIVAFVGAAAPVPVEPFE